VSTSNGANQVIRLPSIVSQSSSPVSTIQHIRLPTVNASTVAGLQQVRMPVTSGIQQVIPNKQVIQFNNSLLLLKEYITLFFNFIRFNTLD
jgi:hypothetical protein